MVMENNEYFDLYCKICNSGTSEIQKIRESLSKKFPHSFDPNYTNDMTGINYDYSANPYLSRFVFREKLVKIYAWAITDPNALKAIVRATKDTGIVEIGAGKGYWASLLANCGVNVVAYDNGEDKYIGGYYPVEEAGIEMVAFHQDKALFLCWPPYDTSMAYDCVSKYKGNTLIYIGEDFGGCNANDDFFHFVSKNFKLDCRIDMAKWEGLHDNLYIYRR